MDLPNYDCIQLCHWTDSLGKCINPTDEESEILVQSKHVYGSDNSNFLLDDEK